MNYEGKLEASLFGLDLELSYTISSKYIVAVDTPVDLIKDDPRSFMKNLALGKFKVSKETYELLRLVHSKAMKDEPSLPYNLPKITVKNALENVYSLLNTFSTLGKMGIVFIGRSSLLTMVYFGVKEYLSSLKEVADIYWLRSRNESKGGLKDYSTMAGIKSLKTKMKTEKYRIVTVVDDISITGKTLETLEKELSFGKVKTVGIPVIGNVYTWVISEYPNRNHPSYESVLEIYHKMFKPKQRLEKKWKVRLYKRFKEAPIIPGLLVSSPYSNTLSHITGDTIEEAKIKGIETENLSVLEEMLVKKFTEPLETYGINKISKSIIIQPRTR